MKGLSRRPRTSDATNVNRHKMSLLDTAIDLIQTSEAGCPKGQNSTAVECYRTKQSSSNSELGTPLKKYFVHCKNVATCQNSIQKGVQSVNPIWNTGSFESFLEGFS